MTKNIKIERTKQPYAIVIGLDSFTGLQTVRILAKRGIPVIAIAENLDHACSQTNVCKYKLSAGLGNGEFVELLKNIADQFEDPPVLVPCSDITVLHISRNREALAPHYRIGLPEADTVEMLVDKVRFYTFAMKEGFPIPQTYFLRSESEMEAIADEMHYPCMMKPPLKSPEWLKRADKVIKIENAKELRTIYRKMQPFVDIIMVQQWVEGNDESLFSLNCYFGKDHQPKATFIARKIRQWPIQTGVSSLGVEVRNDVVLNESVSMFKFVNYVGLGYVEMKKDSITGNHYIIEPNIGRPTGRSAISEAGGVPLLYTMYCDLVGLPLPEPREQKYGNAKWIYLRRDLQSAYAYWKKGELTFGQWLKSMSGKKFYAVFSLTDPKPFFADIQNTFFKKVVKKEGMNKKEQLTNS